jgi:hypothetical protein
MVSAGPDFSAFFDALSGWLNLDEQPSAGSTQTTIAAKRRASIVYRFLVFMNLSSRVLVVETT